MHKNATNRPREQISNQLRQNMSPINSIAVRIAGIGLTLATTIIAARYLGVTQFGIFSHTFSVCLLLAGIGSPGFVAQIVRQVAYAGTAKSALSLALVFLSFSCVSVTLLFYFLKGYVFLPSVNLPFFTLWGISILTSAITIFSASARGMGLSALGQIPDLFLKPALIVSLMLIAAIFATLDTANQVFEFMLISQFMVLCIILIWLYRSKPKASPNNGHKVDIPSILKTHPKLALVAILSLSSTQLPIILAGSVISSEASGIVRIALQFSALTLLGLTTAELIHAPVFAKLWKENKLDDLKEVVSRNCTVAFSFFTLASLGLVIIVTLLFSLVFDANYSDVKTLIPILLIGNFASAYCGSILNLLIATGHEAKALKILIFSFSILCLSLYFLGQAYGTLGIVTAVSLTLVIRSILMAWVIHKTLGITVRPTFNIRAALQKV
jgi:O-antigen/teichoic acid export membrane protein